ncbi:hypothetical protein [Companilactobacillus mishanensis]|uniref:Uncharacterized protein n=1 Tax=Companilactobacillus mishanensis TaxID=2486008 RepID=A0A5P0ZGH3_9LACO|nr:hypothetical protein [Companilactobacillus mishanensis]MQS52147.1 hypothetical protein [Companilactobacillus mishanensis]MQS88264.1 hypothetical protein [Companilactobacillus mishanensis]
MTENKQLINFNLSEIADGAAQEKFAKELKEVCNNILDLNTEAKTKRKITMDLTFVPNDTRDAIDTVVSVKSRLAPQIGVSTTMLLGRNEDTGMMAANELKSGVPGQTYFDDKDSTLKTDTGKPVDEVEEQTKNIIDLQNKKA